MSTFKIMTFNVKGAFFDDGDNNWVHRWPLTVSAIRRCVPDVIGFQEVQPLLACADVFLLPSEEESFGLAALEALACGTPAVTTDVGGIGELMKNGENGYMAPLGDAAAMARGVLELTSDTATRRRFREGARASAARFDAERIIPMYERFYERVLA